MKPKVILETERLILRELSLADTEAMLRLYSNPDVMKYTADELVTSNAGIQGKIGEKISEYRKYGYGRWATVLKEGQQFIGWSGLAYLPRFDEIDVGYRFLPEFWGKGLATEATVAILQYAFRELKLRRIVAIAMKENKASIRVMEKAGMHFEKFAPYFPEGEDVAWYHIESEPKNQSL